MFYIETFPFSQGFIYDFNCDHYICSLKMPFLLQDSGERHSREEGPKQREQCRSGSYEWPPVKWPDPGVQIVGKAAKYRATARRTASEKDAGKMDGQSPPRFFHSLSPVRAFPHYLNAWNRQVTGKNKCVLGI